MKTTTSQNTFRMPNCSTFENERKHFISEIRKKCCFVEEAISHLQRSRKCIEENASDMRAQIVSDVNAVLDCLRKREINLLRQIDVMEAHQLNALQTTYAELHHLLGNLRHVFYCVENQLECHSCGQHECDMDILEAIKKQQTTYTPICYWADIQEMEALIRNFGLVRTSPMLYQEDGNLTSSCLPSKMEEYGEDHQLLYKTLNEMREDAKITGMTNNLEGWLRYCDEPVSPVNYSDRCYLPECYQSEDNSYWLRKEPCDVNERTEKWLQDIKMNGCFRKMNSNRKDENSENYKEDQKSEDFTSSIDVISVSDILGTTTNNSVSLMEASSGYSVKAAMPVTRDTVGGKINKIHCCNITTKGAVDIENLATITCSNKESISREDDRWLIRGRTETSLEQSLAGILNIADICCANEPCKCFNECICKEKCSQKALEKQAYLNCNFEADKNIFLRKTTRRLNSDDDIWLRKSVFDTETECEKSWLKIDTITNSEKMDISEKGEVNESTLSQDTAADKEFKDISDKFDVLPLYNDNKLWVKCSQIPLIFESFSFIREDFQPYFLCNDVNTWLSS